MTKSDRDSPCVKICKVDRKGYCLACFRSIGEIEAWGVMTNSKREVVSAECIVRKDVKKASNRATVARGETNG